MKKLFISIFLMLAMLVSGLSSMSSTPIASAINKSAVRCDFLGQYINPNSNSKNCEPCPIDFYCPLVSGTEIENCSTKGYPDSDCKETRKIFSTDKAIACDAGKTTKGFTFNTLQGTRITTSGDPLFPIVGQGATDKSMCQAPDFVCSGSTPVLLKGLDGVAKCFPTNTCNEDQVAILKNGIPDCSVACKDTIVNGKCYQNCPSGQYLEVVNNSVNGVNTQTVNCKAITVKPIDCLIPGQVPTILGDIKTCACIAPQVYNANTTKCEIPVIPCTPPQTGNQPNCVNPPANPCPANFYGYSQPNCKLCPNGGTSPAGTIDSSGCVIPVIPCPTNYFGVNGNVLCTPCPNNGTSPAGTKDVSGCSIPAVVVVPCPTNYFGVNGNVLCTPCPNNGTSPAGTKDVSGCKAQENGGGGFCSGFWAVLCGGAVVAGIDCFLTKIVCNRSNPTSNPTAKITTTSTDTQISRPADVNDVLAVVPYTTTNKVSQTCTSLNGVYVGAIMSQYLEDAHVVNGQNYVWVATVAAGQQTEKMSTVRVAGGITSTNVDDFNNKQQSSELVCLMTRFAKKSNSIFGSSDYMGKLERAGVLHGLNKKYKLECLNLDNLLNYLVDEGENSSEQTTQVTTYSVSNVTKGFSYAERYNTQEEATIAMKKIAAEQSGKARQSGNVPANRRLRKIITPRRVTGMIPNFVNLFMPISAAALVASNVDQSELADKYEPTAPSSSDNEFGSDNETTEEEGAAVDSLTIGGDEAVALCSELFPGDTEADTEIFASNGESICASNYDNQQSQEYIDQLVYETLYSENQALGLSISNDLEANGCPKSEPNIVIYDQIEYCSANINDQGNNDEGLGLSISGNQSRENPEYTMSPTDPAYSQYYDLTSCYDYAPYLYQGEYGANCRTLEQIKSDVADGTISLGGNPSNEQTTNGCPSGQTVGYWGCQQDTNYTQETNTCTNRFEKWEDGQCVEVFDNGKTAKEIAATESQESVDCSNGGNVWDSQTYTCQNRTTQSYNALSEADKCYNNNGSYGDEVDEDGNTTGRMKCTY